MCFQKIFYLSIAPILVVFTKFLMREIKASYSPIHVSVQL
jgi:hypothetical protein